MNLSVVRIDKDKWAEMAHDVHINVFGELPSSSKVDFALVVQNNSLPCFYFGYVTCRELDAETLYWSYGGMFEKHRNTNFSLRAMYALLGWCSERYARLNTLIEQENTKMQRLSLKAGWLVSGVKQFKHELLIELTKEFRG